MNKQLCFIIEKQSLYLEKVLVFFNDVPLFFICRNDENQRFLILCTELEQFEYLIVQMDLSNLRNMLLQKCTMRNAILNGEMFWKVVSGNTIENDFCEAIDKSKIDLSLLPNEGALYKKVFQEDEDYIKQIESEYLKRLKFDAIDEINVLINSTDILTENLNIIIDNISDSISTMVEYFDVGPSIDSITNGVKKIFSDKTMDLGNSKKFGYKQKYENMQTEFTIKKSTLTSNDEFTNLAA